MTEPVKEFDRSKYSGQVHAWFFRDGVNQHGKPRERIWICRRYTNEEYDDDDQWGCWINVCSNDQREITIKLLHFCSYLNYEVVSQTSAHADDPDSSFHEATDDETISYQEQSDELYNKYKAEADKADTLVEGIGEEVHEELSSLFASFSVAQKLALDLH